MRGLPWLVGLVCVLLVLVPTSMFVGAQEPTPSAPDERYAAEATKLQQWTGRSALHLRGACLDERATCVDMTREDGMFFLPSPAAGGDIVVSWRPVNDSLRVLRVRMAGVEVTGESPLRLSFDGLHAGEHSIRIEPARTIVGSYDQSADWVATFALTPLEGRVETRGASTYRTMVGCVLGTCDPATYTTGDSFLAPWTAHGGITATWDRLDGPMRLLVRDTDMSVEGEPPLTLEVYALPPGQYTVDVRPALADGPLADVSVAWVATLEPDG